MLPKIDVPIYELNLISSGKKIRFRPFLVKEQKLLLMANQSDDPKDSLNVVKQIYAVELIDAFPIGISPQSLSWSDENFHRLQIQFAYQKYRVIYDGTYDLAAAATAVLGSAASRLLPFGKATTRLPFGF